jgi:M6 family metalloprotease-like protein
MATHAVRGYRRSVALVTALLTIAGTMLVAPTVVLAADPPALDPIDPQVVTQAADQDWDDYHPIPNAGYATDGSPGSVTTWDVALILTDFPGTPFAVTQPQGSTVFGNPGPLAHDLPRSSVGAFYRDWLNVPQAINEYQGMNRYWMEDTYGKYGVHLEAYGPYELIGTQDDYFINDISGSSNATCNTQARTANNGTPQLAVTDVALALPSTSASFSVGKILRGIVTGSTTTFNRVVTEIPDAGHIRTGAASTMAAASVATATNIKYTNTAGLQGLAAGHSLTIGFGDRLETRNIVSVGTSGAGGTGITLDSALNFDHATNTPLRDMTTTPINSVPANAFIYSCDRNSRTDSLIAWADHATAAERAAFDNTFYVYAGQDESGTWQEFGEMQFTGGPSQPDTVPEAFGPPNNEIPRNWAETRYIPWTSWRSAATVWPNASGTNSLEGEGSGMAVYAHELTHNLGIADNYNNPYIAPFQRAATGYWSMMSRGSFGGPGGTHTRWNIPSTMGTALGSQHVLRDKIKLGSSPNPANAFVTAQNFTDLNRNGLGISGLAVLTIQAREVNPGANGQVGVRINLDGAAPADKTPACTVMATPRILATVAAVGDTNIKVDSVTNFVVNGDVVVGDRGNDELVRVASVGTAGAGGTGITFTTPLTKAHAAGEIVSNRLSCSGGSGFNNFSMEVVQQLGSDSFQADTGVLIEKNRVSEGTSCGTFSCFAWIVDAHPTDINMLDFHRPDGTDQWVTTGDPRQLTDAPFHAGLNSGSLYEWEDPLNGLHFYILDKLVDDDGVVSYKVAVQNINGAGPHVRGVDVADSTPVSLGSNYGYCNFNLTNTGSFSNFANPHPENVDALVSNDVYRLSASATGTGWHAQLANALTSAAFGASVEVPVYVTRDDGADAYASVQLTATSVSDGTKTDLGTCSLDDVAPTTTAELSPAPTNGFYHDPTVTLTADDDGGVGVASTEYKLDEADWQTYSAPFQVTGDGDHTLLFHSTDLAGNVEADNQLDFTIDTTGPVITITAPVEAATLVAGDPGNYPLDSEQAAVYGCTDAISGVDEDGCVGTVPNGANFDTSLVGYHDFTVNVMDVAGNPSTLSIQYNVYWDQWSDFTGNIDPDGLNVVQAGSVVPVKFSLGGDFGLGVFKPGTPTSQQVNCTTQATIGSPSAAQSPGGNAFTYADGQYQFNWKTVAGWKNTCRVFTVELIDNTTHTALFSFIK